MKQKPQDLHPEPGRIIQYNTIQARLYPTPEQEALFQNAWESLLYSWVSA